MWLDYAVLAVISCLTLADEEVLDRYIRSAQEEEVLHREKRSPSAYTAAEQKIILDSHNRFRKYAGAMNMLKMSWHDKLAQSAQKLADSCVYKHAFKSVPGLEYTEATYGQNMLFHSSKHEIDKITGSWHSEIAYYNYKDNKCQTGKMCGHYTQVVWYNTIHVGCGYKKCPKVTVSGNDFTDAYVVVCNYGPGGNLNNLRPFAKGKPCARCETGVGFCDKDGFCDPKCKAPSADCVCKMVCARGFPNDAATCKCKCGDGYRGKYCLDSEEELSIGIVMNMDAKIDDWSQIWSNLQQLVAQALNDFCRLNPNQCCDGAQKKAANANLEFMSHTDVQHGARYPIDKGSGALEVLIFAKSDDSKACDSLAKNASRRRRRKRATEPKDGGLKIPKDVLLTAVKKDMDKINKKMEECCDAKVDKVEAAPDYVPKYTGLKGWEIALIVIGVLLFIVIIAVILAVLDRMQETKRDKKMKELRGDEKVQGVDNPQMTADAAM